MSENTVSKGPWIWKTDQPTKTLKLSSVDGEDLGIYAPRRSPALSEFNTNLALVASSGKFLTAAEAFNVFADEVGNHCMSEKSETLWNDVMRKMNEAFLAFESISMAVGYNEEQHD